MSTLKNKEHARSPKGPKPDPKVLTESKTSDGLVQVINVENRYTNLDYLKKRTKSNPVLLIEMITIYLKQTPPLIILMKESMLKNDWSTVYAAVHKLIPSFSIMGLSPDAETLAKKVQEYAGTETHTAVIPELVLQIENVCNQAFIELQEELNLLNTTS